MARTIQPTSEQTAIDQRTQIALAQFERDLREWRKRDPQINDRDVDELWNEDTYQEPLAAYAQMVGVADACFIPGCWTQRDHRIKCDAHLDAISPI